MKAISKQAQNSRSRSKPQDPDWDGIPSTFRSGGLLPPHWDGLFGPLRNGTVDDLVVIAQMGQSLDGRIATPTGHSHYINGAAGREHLHRLRALVDAIVVGVATVVADDPQLTVRLVHGPCPARVVLDPSGRAAADARVFATDGARRLIVTAATGRAPLPAGVEIVNLPLTDGLPPRRFSTQLPSAAFAASWSKAARRRSPAFSPRPVSIACISWWRRSFSAPALPDWRWRRSHGSTKRCGRRSGSTASPRKCCSTAIFPRAEFRYFARRGPHARRDSLSPLGRGLG